jgi:hypothetical protein
MVGSGRKYTDDLSCRPLGFSLECREFSNERNRVERRQEFTKMRKRENFYRAIEGYFNWIVEAGFLANPPFKESIERQSCDCSA